MREKERAFHAYPRVGQQNEHILIISSWISELYHFVWIIFWLIILLALPISYLNQWEGLGHEQKPFLFYFVCFSLCNPYCIGHFWITITVFFVHSVSTTDDQTDHELWPWYHQERECVCLCVCFFASVHFCLIALFDYCYTQLYLIGSC